MRYIKPYIWKNSAIILFLFVTTYIALKTDLLSAWLTFSFVTYLGGLYLYRVVFRMRKYSSVFAQLPMTKIAHMSLGKVALKGRLVHSEPLIKAPYDGGLCLGYRCQYYQGEWKKDGTLHYEAAGEDSEFIPLSLVDDSGEIAIQTSEIEALDGITQEIKIGRNLVKLSCLKINTEQTYVVTGCYQRTNEGTAILTSDDMPIRYVNESYGEVIHHRQKHLQLLQQAKLFSVIASMIVITEFLLLGYAFSSVLIDPMMLLIIYFCVSLVWAFIVTKKYRVKGVENKVVTIISIALFPNCLVILMAMLLGVNTIALFLGMLTIFIVTYIFVHRYHDLLITYWNSKPDKGQP